MKKTQGTLERISGRLFEDLEPAEIAFVYGGVAAELSFSLTGDDQIEVSVDP